MGGLAFSTQNQQRLIYVTVVDTTPPEWSSVELNNIIVRTADTSVEVSYNTPTGNDIVDGIVTATCDPASGSRFTSGETTTVTCTLTDSQGNTNSEMKSFTVQVMRLTVQFPLQPVDEPGPSVFKLGSTIPLKLTGSWDNVPATDLIAKISAIKTTSAGTSSPVTEEISTASPTSGDTMRLDSSSGQYIFNFNTKNIAKSGTYTSLTFTVRVSTADNPSNIVHTESVTVGVR